MVQGLGLVFGSNAYRLYRNPDGGSMNWQPLLGRPNDRDDTRLGSICEAPDSWKSPYMWGTHFFGI